MDDKEECNTGLVLGLGGSGYVTSKRNAKRENNVKPMSRFDFSFSLCPKVEVVNVNKTNTEQDNHIKKKNNEIPENNNDDNGSNNYNNNSGGRKKLRLTVDQSKLLEESFKLHNTLNMGQKQELAEKLNLKPRQVEVWFQNRRARTKLKQTEIDCEFLRKYCENLSEENKRLKKEIQELQCLNIVTSTTPSSHLFIQLPKSSPIKMCPSCGKITRNTTSETKK